MTVERGGTNAVPDWCESTVDMRYPPGRQYPADLESFHLAFGATVDAFLRERVPTDGWTFSVRVRWTAAAFRARWAGTARDAASHPLVASALRASERGLGYQPDIETAPGGTDATVMIHAGHIPTLVEMGAAGGLSHDYHEFVERDMIGAGARVLALMAIDVLGLAEESVIDLAMSGLSTTTCTPGASPPAGERRGAGGPYGFFGRGVRIPFETSICRWRSSRAR